jgi:hypothetical protein
MYRNYFLVWEIANKPEKQQNEFYLSREKIKQNSMTVTAGATLRSRLVRPHWGGDI